MKWNIKYIGLCLLLMFGVESFVEGHNKTTIDCAISSIFVGKDSSLGLSSSLSSSFNIAVERTIIRHTNKVISVILGSGASPRIAEHAREAVANACVGGLIKYRFHDSVIGGFRLVCDAGILNIFKKPIMYRVIGAIDAYASLFGTNISYVTVLGCLPLKNPQLQYDIDVDVNLMSQDAKERMLRKDTVFTDANIVKKAYWIYPQAAVEVHVGQQIFDKLWGAFTFGVGISTHKTELSYSALEYFSNLRVRYYFESTPVYIDVGVQASQDAVISLFVSLNVCKMYHDNIGYPITIDDMMHMSLVHSTLTKRTGYILSDQYVADVDKILDYARYGGYTAAGTPVNSFIKGLVKAMDETGIPV